ncbi:MAG: hypothetical protein OXT09_06405 [Myxococcales bacterium]|nr:hypothetical protein [Myxococcales bacterium]
MRCFRRPAAALLASLCALWACTERGFVLSLQGDHGAGDNSADAGAFYDMGVAPGGCDTFTPGDRFGLCSASYLGGAGEDRADGVTFDRDGNLLVAARLSETPFGLSEQRLGAGEAGVLRLSPTGRAALSWTPLASRIRDMAVGGSDGRIALATEDGVSVLDSEARELLWMREEEGGVERVDVGGDGSVATLLVDGTIVLLTPDGSPRTAFRVVADRVEDLTLDTDSDLIHVAGGRAAEGCPGLMPFLRAYSQGGREQWRRFDFADADGHCDSAWGRRVTIGADGQLYYAGQNEGEDTPHLRDPQDVSVPAAVAGGDAYGAPEGATEPFAFVARFDPSTGEMDRAQVLITRDGERGGRVRINAIDADEQGHIFLAGEAGCCIDRRDELRVGGVRPGEFDQSDIFVAVLSPDLDEREAWVTFTGQAGSNALATGVAVGGRFAAVVGNQPEPGPGLITLAALAPEPLGSSDAFVAVWPAP